MSKQIIRITEVELRNIIEETVKSSLFEDMICGMGMKPNKMMDKYSEFYMLLLIILYVFAFIQIIQQSLTGKKGLVVFVKDL